MGLKQFFGKTLQQVWDWDDGSITIARMLIGPEKVPYGAANPMPVATTGTGLLPSGTTPVASEGLVLNTLSSAITPKAGRGLYAWLSGTGTAAGYFVFSKDGSAWFQLFVEGNQMAVWSYAKPANAGSQTITGQVISIPPLDQAVHIRLVPTSLSGTVNLEITQ